MKSNNFIHKLYNLLSNPEHSKYLEWQPLGTSFVIKEVSGFSEHVLPVVFKHKNYTSFVRQLNLYGFHKINRSYAKPGVIVEERDQDTREFFHEKFLRNRRDLLGQIRRKQSVRPAPFDPFKNAAETMTPAPTEDADIGSQVESDPGQLSDSDGKESDSEIAVHSPKGQLEDRLVVIEKRQDEIVKSISHIATSVENLVNEIHDMKKSHEFQRKLLEKLDRQSSSYAPPSPVPFNSYASQQKQQQQGGGAQVAGPSSSQHQTSGPGGVGTPTSPIVLPRPQGLKRPLESGYYFPQRYDSPYPSRFDDHHRNFEYPPPSQVSSGGATATSNAVRAVSEGTATQMGSCSFSSKHGSEYLPVPHQHHHHHPHRSSHPQQQQHHHQQQQHQRHHPHHLHRPEIIPIRQKNNTANTKGN